ncbi:MFS transporter [Phaeacidiphilus oryzae]|uniref:MFS transporter n=1 Tax=Phaeacidiphilus oryzae TaxID=348818 RepID=UPI000690B8D0|nr:MFS transporter [Phaeacidiphilus oryzae]
MATPTPLSPAAAPAAAATVRARSALAALGDSAVGALHRRVLLTVSAMFLFDLADLNTFAYAAPVLRDRHGFTVDDVALVTATGFGGMAIGSVIGGRLADRIGRRAGMTVSVLLFSLASLVNALVSAPGEMAVTRSLTGCGLGAMTAIAISYLSEVTPTRQRGRFQAVALGVGLIGIPIVAFGARAVTVDTPGSWRWLFVFGALGFLLLPFLWRLPESPRWLLARGRAEEAVEVVRRFAPSAVAADTAVDTAADIAADHGPDRGTGTGTGTAGDSAPGTGSDVVAGTAESAPAEAVPPPKAAFGELFRAGQLRNTLVIMVLWAFALTGFYGFQSWVPTLLVDHGHDFAKSMTMSAVTTIGAVPGAFLAAPFIDRFQRKHLAVVLGLIITALGIGYGLSGGAAAIMVFGVLVSALSQCFIAVLYSYTPEYFPTRLRTAGSGLANGTGRAANVAAPFLIAAVYTAPGLGYVAVFGFVAGVWLVAALVVALLGLRTRGSSLEELHGES